MEEGGGRRESLLRGFINVMDVTFISPTVRRGRKAVGLDLFTAIRLSRIVFDSVQPEAERVVCVSGRFFFFPFLFWQSAMLTGQRPLTVVPRGGGGGGGRRRRWWDFSGGRRSEAGEILPVTNKRAARQDEALSST